MSGPTLDIRPAGDRALLVTPSDQALLTGLAAALRQGAPAGMVDVALAARTLLVTTTLDADRRVIETALAGALAASAAHVGAGPDATVVEIPVRYDGADLEEAAGLLGMTRDELVSVHTGQVWQCAFIGFAPGFGYLRPTRTALEVPRRAQSRPAVPAGSVALADGFSAVYPRRTPGGWQLIGTTPATMWDLDREEPALVPAGRSVRFVEER